MEAIIFETDFVKKAKIFYKNGQTYTAKNLNDFSVIMRKGGGCDVQYTVKKDSVTPYGERIDLEVHETKGEDVVAYELYDVMVDGQIFSKIYDRLK